MAVLNHHIVPTRNKEETALFFAEVLGLPTPLRLGHFAVLSVGGGTTLDFADSRRDFDKLHYAFLVTETEFDDIFGRLQQRSARYWADPAKTDEGHINSWDDGRGVYFEDPNGHLLEILTRPYGSNGTAAAQPHPLIAAPIEPPSGR